MFIFALITGIYSYIIFFLGISNVLQKNIVVVVTVLYLILLLILFSKKVLYIFKKNIPLIKHSIVKHTYFSLLGGVFILQILVNLLGALSPELSFDALWYHLTLPKMFLEEQKLFYIPGGLLYYSVMPKLGEMLYIGALSLGNETFVKVTHLVFGLLTCIAVYKLSRAFLPKQFSFLAVCLFYANIVVAWESTTAYVDLIRAFYEVMALWAFVLWLTTKKRLWLAISAVMVGLAITAKLLAFGSLIIFTVLIIWCYWRQKEVKHVLLALVAYWSIALLIPLPWFLFAYLHTGNPVYPFFSTLYAISPEPLSLIGFFKDVWGVFLFAADPISPIYVILFPLVVWLMIIVKGKNREVVDSKLLILYSMLAIIIWYFTPRTGGGRFMLPYLPAFSILCASVVFMISQQKKYFTNLFLRTIFGIILMLSVIAVVYRSGASIKYVPYLLGQQTKHEFLSSQLNFAFGDFYDTDNFFKSHIKPDETVLLYGFHNLYYVDFQFIDATWVKEGDKFDYIAVQDANLPEKYRDWQLIYKNAKTMVQLYGPPKEKPCPKQCVY